MAESGRCRNTLIWALCLVVLVIVGAIGLAKFGCQNPVVGGLLGCGDDGDTILFGVKRLNELATAEMPAQVVEKEENADLFLPGILPNLPDGIFGQKVILVARGEVKAGIDLDELHKDDVHVDGEKVTIDLPEARILDSSLDEDKTKVYDWDRGLLVKGDYALVEDARREALDKIEAAARDEHIVEKAQNNAEASIREFLKFSGYKKVDFESAKRP